VEDGDAVLAVAVDVDRADDADRGLRVAGLAARRARPAVEGDRTSARAVLVGVLARVEVPQERERVRPAEAEGECDADWDRVQAHGAARQPGNVLLDSWLTHALNSDARPSIAGAAPVDTAYTIRRCTMLQQKRRSAQDGQRAEDMTYLFVRPKGDAILLSCHTRVPAIPQSAIAPQPTWSNGQGQFATCIADAYRARCYAKKHQNTLIVEAGSTHIEGSASRVRSDNDGCRRVTIAVPMTPPNCKDGISGVRRRKSSRVPMRG
jgi:hypothetical protein